MASPYLMKSRRSLEEIEATLHQGVMTWRENADQHEQQAVFAREQARLLEERRCEIADLIQRRKSA